MRWLRRLLNRIGWGIRWQPIETAPRDGTRQILLFDGLIFACSWKTDRGEFWTADFAVNWASHWAPIPNIPDEKHHLELMSRDDFGDPR